MPSNIHQHELAPRFDRHSRHFDEVVAERFVRCADGGVERFGFDEGLGAFGVVDVNFGPRGEDENRALVAASGVGFEATLVEVAEDVGKGSVEEAEVASFGGVVVAHNRKRRDLFKLLNSFEGTSKKAI